MVEQEGSMSGDIDDLWESCGKPYTYNKLKRKGGVKAMGTLVSSDDHTKFKSMYGIVIRKGSYIVFVAPYPSEDDAKKSFENIQEEFV